MRILHVSAYYAPAFVYGGPPRSIHGLCLALRQHGVDVSVYTTDANGAGTLPPHVTEPHEYREGVPVTYFPRSWPRRFIGSRGLEGALRGALGGTLGGKPGFDVVHIHGLWNRVVWAAAREARRAGVPYVLSPRGMLEGAAIAHHAWRKRAVHAVVERRTIAGAAVVHATSEPEAETVRAAYPGVRVVVIPNGIDSVMENGTLTRQDLGLPRTAPLILFLGRLHPIKRLDLLVDAFLLLKAAHPAAHLVIAGPDEFQIRSGLNARAGAAAGAISWVGSVDAGRRDSLLHHASALVMCSNSESFGMSVLEAMLAGVPVVVTRTCGWRDVDRHRAGFLVDQRDEAVAGALAEILRDPAAAREMGQRGRTLARSTYRWDTIAGAFCREYETLAAVTATAALAS